MFASPTAIAAGCAIGTPYCGATTAAAIADLNGDGILDLVTANDNLVPLWGSYTIIPGLGDGVFGAPIFTDQPEAHLLDVDAADLDLDGDQDLVLVNRAGNHVRVLANLGNGTFAPPLIIPVGAAPETAVVADFNKDGRPDLAVHNTSGTGVSLVYNVSVPGSGEPKFLPEKRIVTPTGSWWSISEVHSGCHDAAGDVNGDGWPDLAIATGAGFKILLNNGAGMLVPDETLVYPGGSAVVQVILADLDGDGWPDAAAPALTKGQTGHASLAVWRNIGRPAGGTESQFEPPVLHDTSTVATTWANVVLFFSAAIAAGDFDGDQDLDLAVNFFYASWQIVILPNQGDGTFGAPIIRPALGRNTAAGYFLRALDINADGLDDLVHVGNIGTYRPDVAVYLSLPGTPVAAPESNEEFGLNYPGGNYAPIFIDVGQIDGQGGLDLVTADNLRLGIHLDQGGSYIGKATLVPVEVPPPYPAVIHAIAVDLNSDGVDEVVGGDTNKLSPLPVEGRIVVFGNPGDGALFVQQVLPTPGVGFDYRLDHGDIDHDGDQDVVAWTLKSFSNSQLPMTRYVLVLTNDGAGQLTLSQTLAISEIVTHYSPGAVKLADLDGDGWLDVAATAGSGVVSQTYWVRVVWNDGTGAFKAFSEAQLPPKATGIASADIDGDGLSDLIVIHTHAGLIPDTTAMSLVRLLPGRQLSVAFIDPDLTQWADKVVRVVGKTPEGFTRIIRNEAVRNIAVIDLKPDFTVARRVNYAAVSDSAFGMALLPHPDGRTDVVLNDFGAMTLLHLRDRRCIAPACLPDCDQSGGLDIDDFICFQTLYAIGSPKADCDKSGALDIDDFICFQTFFAIGC